MFFLMQRQENWEMTDSALEKSTLIPSRAIAVSQPKSPAKRFRKSNKNFNPIPQVLTSKPDINKNEHVQ